MQKAFYNDVNEVLKKTGQYIYTKKKNTIMSQLLQEKTVI